MMRVLSEPREGALSLVVTQLEENVEVPLKPLAFVLSLEQDPEANFTSGRISLVNGEGTYPIRGSRALFDLLYDWLNPNLAGGSGV